MAADELQIVITAKDQAKTALASAKASVRDLEKQIVAANKTLAETGKGAGEVDKLRQSYVAAQGQVRTLSAEHSKLTKQLTNISTEPISRMGQAWQKATGYIVEHKNQIALAGVAAGWMMERFVASSFAAADAAGKSNARIEQVFKSMGDATGEAAKWSEDYANTQQYLVGVDDEVIKGGMAKLATFQDVSSEVARSQGIYQRATDAMVDLSATGFGDVDSAAVQLGKALQDPVKGLNAMARSGITFSESQTETIKALVKSGDLLGAQKIILSAVESQVKGVAASMTTDADRARIAWGEFQETVGNDVTPAVNGLLKSLTGGLKAIGEWPEWARKLTLILAGLGVAAMVVGPRMLSMRASMLQARAAAMQMGTAGETAGGKLSKLGTIAKVAGGFLAALAIVSVIGSMFKAAEVNLSAFTLALEKFGKDGSVSGEAATVLGDNLSGVNDALVLLTEHDDWRYGFGNALSDWFSQGSGALTQARTKLNLIDQALTDIQGRDPGLAASTFERLKTSATAAGIPVDQLNQMFPEYTTAVARAGSASDTAAGAARRLGGALVGVTAEAGKFITVEDVLKGRLSAIGAHDDVIRATKALTQSVQDNGRVFKGNSDAALANRSALMQVVQAKITANQTKLQSEDVNVAAQAMNNLKAGIFSAARQAGMSKKEAHALAEEYTGAWTAGQTVNSTVINPKAEPGGIKDLNADLLNTISYINTINSTPVNPPAGKPSTGPPDTPSPLGTGGFGQAMSAHAAITSALSGGVSIRSSLRTTNLGSPNSDHLSGRALDLTGRGTNSYARMVKSMGGFAAFHGSGADRHLHVVPVTRQTRIMPAPAANGQAAPSSGEAGGEFHFHYSGSGNIDMADVRFAATQAARAYADEQRRLAGSRR